MLWTVLTCPVGFGMYFVWIKVLNQPVRYAMLWPVFAIFATHISSVVIPLVLHYREVLHPIHHDARNFQLVLSSPTLFALLCLHSVNDFTAENTRFIEVGRSNLANNV